MAIKYLKIGDSEDMWMWDDVNSSTAISTDGDIDAPNVTTSEQVAKIADIDGKLQKDKNLSDVVNVPTARANLGLGTIATQAANNVAITGGTASVATVATTSTTDATSTTAAPLKTAGGLAVAKKAYFGGAIEAVGGQIKFPATQIASADANTLDDYEEGTWTPSLTFGGGAVDLFYGSRSGTYTKIGNIVYYYWSFTLMAKGSSTGPAIVGGLPFTAKSGLFPDASVRAVSSVTFTAPLYSGVLANTTDIFLMDYWAGEQRSLTETAFVNTSEMTGTGFYFV